jgi:hypothetical protein
MDWSVVKLKGHAGQTFVLTINIMGGMRDKPGSGIWSLLFLLTERPTTACVTALFNQLNEAERQRFGGMSYPEKPVQLWALTQLGHADVLRFAFMQTDYGKELRLASSLFFNKMPPGAADVCIRRAILALKDPTEQFTAHCREKYHIGNCTNKWMATTYVPRVPRDCSAPR